MALTEQFGRFLLVGATAAIVDICGYHWLTGRFPKLGHIPANVLSTTVAMTLSFTLNSHWVFSRGGSDVASLIRFLVTTLIAAYGIQSVVICVFSKTGRGQACVSSLLSGALGIRERLWKFYCGRGRRAVLFDKLLREPRDTFSSPMVVYRSQAVLERNAIKAVALITALIWNFCLYRWYVFA